MITRPLIPGDRVTILTPRPLVGIYDGDVGRVFNVHADHAVDVEVHKPSEQADGGTFATRATFGADDVALLEDPPAPDGETRPA